MYRARQGAGCFLQRPASDVLLKALHGVCPSSQAKRPGPSAVRIELSAVHISGSFLTFTIPTVRNPTRPPLSRARPRLLRTAYQGHTLKRTRSTAAYTSRRAEPSQRSRELGRREECQGAL